MHCAHTESSQSCVVGDDLVQVKSLHTQQRQSDTKLHLIVLNPPVMVPQVVRILGVVAHVIRVGQAPAHKTSPLNQPEKQYSK